MTSSLYGRHPSDGQKLKEANTRIAQLEAELAAVQVPEEVLEAAHGIDQMTPQMPYDPFLKQHRIVCNFILGLAGRKGGSNAV